MYKLLMSSLLASVLLLPTFATGAAERDEIRLEKTYRLEHIQLEDLQTNPEIRAQLTESERMFLTNKLSLDPTQAIVSNFIPFGYGSFQQGDVLGGTSIAIMDALSLIALSGDLSLQGSSAPIPLGIFIYGPLFIIARITGFVSPLLHANSHNAAVRKALETPLDVGRSTEPTHTLFSYSMSF